MNTLQNVIPADMAAEEPFTHEPQESRENLYDRNDSGTLDYPVTVRSLDLHKSYLSWIRWHWHEEMQIMIADQGITEVSTDDTSYLIKPGQGLIINQNVMHCIHAHDGQHCTLYLLSFHPDYIFGHKNSYLQTEYLLPMQNYQFFKAFFLDKSAPWHERMLQNLKEAIDLNLAKSFGYEIATKGYLCQFWVELLCQFPQTDVPPDCHISQDEPRVKEAMLFIRTHYAEPLSLQEIADSIHISKSECCRCFARTLQMSPFEYLMKYRIYESTKKLMDPGQSTDSIADIALSVGFNSTSYFNKIFKKFLGCTPTYYRTHKVLHTDSDQDRLSYLL